MKDGLIRYLRLFTSRIASVFGRSARERDIEDELVSHLEAHIEDNIRAGMTPVEARRHAILALGGVQQTKEQVRDRIGLPRLEALAYDLRHAIRGLARRKVLVLTAIVSIAFGVGVNIAAYTVLRGLLFRGWVGGLPAPERLVTIWPGISFLNYRDLQQRDLPLEMAAMQAATLIWRTDTDTMTVSGRIVSENFFDALRVRPLRGQTFPSARFAAEDRAMVTFDFWQRRLHGDPGVVGRVLNINGWPHTIVGVLPSDFKAPVAPMITASVYVVISPHVNVALENRAAAQFDLIGRLADGASRQSAYAAARAALGQLEREFPEANNGIARELQVFDGTVGPLRAMLSAAPEGRTILTLAGVGYGLVGLVLVIACANITGLLTARADERRHETAVRIALGASRCRLIQQSLAESVVIAVLGCTAGAALWITTMRLLPSIPAIANAGIELVPERLPLLLSAGLMAVVALTCGLTPSLVTANVSPLAALKMARLGYLFRRFRLQRLLVAAQVTVSVVVLLAAFTMAHSYVLLTAVTPGYDVVHTADVSARIPSNPGAGTMGDVKTALERTPGVESVSYGALPLGLLPRSAAIHPIGTNEPRMRIDLHPVGPGYLATMGIPLKTGRDLREDDLTQGADQDIRVVVNESFVRRYLDTGDAMDHRVALERDSDNGRPERTLRVIGVARDTKMRSLADENLPVVYMPARSSLSLVVRVASPAASVVAQLSNTVAQALPGAAISITPMSTRLRRALLPSRIAALLLISLGGMGLLLAMTGLVGIMTSDATGRTFEIGVRIALGATRAAIVWLVLRSSVLVVLISAGVGTIIALLVARALTPLLAAGQSVSDPIAILLVIAVLVAAGAAAGVRPARRAASVDPVIALRTE